MVLQAAAFGEATDCHVHVFEAQERFPMRVKPNYEPPFSPLSALLETAASSGISRFVLVQPTPYADDTALLEASLAALPGRARGVGVAGKETGQEALSSMRKAGIVALRFIETRMADGSRMPGTIPIDALCDHLAPKMRDLGIHAELWSPLSQTLAYWNRLERTGIPVVLDHMAGFNPQAGREDKDFQRLLALLREGAVWVKLALCRRVAGKEYDVLRPFHDDLIEANSGHLLWASDFPFVRYPGTPPAVPDLLQQFLDWVPDAPLTRRILIENPDRLYRFSGLSGA